MRDAIVYGNIKQMRDLQFIFKEINIDSYSQKEEDIFNYLKGGGMLYYVKLRNPILAAN